MGLKAYSKSVSRFGASRGYFLKAYPKTVSRFGASRGYFLKAYSKSVSRFGASRGYFRFSDRILNPPGVSYDVQ